jgi:hypothetical protein
MKGKRFDISFEKDNTHLASKILLIIFILGHLFIFGGNLFIITSAKDVRIYPETLQTETPDNETLILSADILIENDHWNSVNIKDLSLNLTFFTLNQTQIYSESYKKNLISKKQNTTLNFEFEFSTHTLDEETLSILNSTDLICLNINLGFYYSIYLISLNINTTINDLW